tara:strand:+ start:20885 stop:21193 length:309 start_codon:yes stop_codon:yes gene_type:complete
MDECIKLIIENNNRNARDNLVLTWYNEYKSTSIAAFRSWCNTIFSNNKNIISQLICAWSKVFPNLPINDRIKKQRFIINLNKNMVVYIIINNNNHVELGYLG